MGSFLKADIFFFITAAAVVLLTTIAIVLSVYLVKILRNVLYMSRRAKEETDEIVKDIGSFRAALRKELLSTKRVFARGKKFFKIKKGLKKKK